MAKNLEIINDWLQGKNFRPLSINFITDNAEFEKKKSLMEVGERYIDDSGKEWEKTSYGWASVPKVINAIKDTAPKCSACQKEIDLGTKDDKFYHQTKMCFDCTIEMDTKRKLSGTFENYQSIFIFKKQRDYVLDMLKDLRAGLQSLNDKQTIEFINEFGDREKWSGLDVNKIKQEMEKDIVDGEEALKNINQQLGMLNAISQ